MGDRLIPIGFTSSRAPGTADFSMSIPAGEAETDGGSRSGRMRRGNSNRGRDLEEVRGCVSCVPHFTDSEVTTQLMIMEAMRLSLVDHDEHQRKMVQEPPNGTSTNNDSGVPSADSSRRPSIGLPSPLAGGSGTLTKNQGQSSSAASKLFSKFSSSGSRSRSGSSASNKQGNGDQRNVTFAPAPIATGRPSSTLNQAPSFPQVAAHTAPPPRMSPTTAAPVAPVMTLADSTSIGNSSSPIFFGNPPASAGLPRLSMDMAPLSPDQHTSVSAPLQPQRAPFQRAETEVSEAPSETGGRTAYAQLDSDEE